MENRGIPIIDPFEPDKLPAIQKWNFASDFTVRVKFSKQFVDTPKMNTVYVSTKLQYVEFGPQQNDSQEADIFVYGNFPEFFGSTMVVNADTRISAGYLRLSKPSIGNPVLAPQISQEIEFSIGPLADVKLSVKPKRQQVILDQKKPNMTLAIEVTTLSGQEESFVEGNLEINLGGSNLGLIKASSTPGNIVSCRKDGSFIWCKFVAGKYFTKAYINIVLSVQKLALGETTLNEFKFSYRLTWANREQIDREETFSTDLTLKYDAQLKVVALNPSVLLNTNYEKARNRMFYSVQLSNLKESQIGETDVVFYVPHDQEKFKIQDCSEDAKLEQKTDDASRCSSGVCAKCKFTIPVLYSKRETTLSISVEFLEEQFWKKMVKGKEKFWIGGDYEVKEADYKTDTNKFPRNKKGSFEINTVIIQPEFPWWIVFFSLFISITWVALLILGLYKSGFLVKHNPNLIRLDQINENEYVDEEVEPTLTKRGLVDDIDKGIFG
ncbi:uncharacterized protein LOC134844636 [Symsagittifera roscoffensis]|uniref:uncharacterized protein LOC134844636 n=1 Tax=Symsagittifera roscoffensis TaxID=84072 RepID=UPI00307C39FF